MLSFRSSFSLSVRASELISGELVIGRNGRLPEKQSFRYLVGVQSSSGWGLNGQVLIDLGAKRLDTKPVL